MAITMTFLVPGGTKEMYDGLNSEMGTGPSNLPDGLIAHHASLTGDGLRIFDIWESEATWQKFAQEQLGPAMAKSGGPAGPDPEIGQLHNSFKS
jgi:hypothetical protein